MSESEPILAVRDLVIEATTPAGPVRLVDGVSFSVAPHEVLGIVGESGSGKSLSVLAVMGLLPPGLRVAGGEIRLHGRDLARCRPAELRAMRGRRMAMIFQDPMTAFNPVLRIGPQLREAVRLHQPDLPSRAVAARVLELLGLVGIPDPARRCRQFPHEFSGGMRQRAVIAMAIANDPDLLIADEPTTALDVTVQAQVMEVLARARGRTGAAMVLISHDLGLVAKAADRVAVMYCGRLAETGNVADLFGRPSHPYTVGLLGTLPRLDGQIGLLPAIPGQPPSPAQRPTGCAFHPRCGLGRGRAPCAATVPPLRPANAQGQGAACHFAGEASHWRTEVAGSDSLGSPPPVQPASPVLQVEDLRRSFPMRGTFGRRSRALHAVRGVSFSIGRGETLGLVGESGCGKSTLGRVILGLQPADGGRVRLQGTDIGALDRRALRARRRHMQVVFQDPYSSLDPRMTVAEIVAEPLRINGRFDAARVADMVNQVGLPAEALRRRPAQFSGGQRQRIAIARALALGPDLLILDEAVSALDVSIQAQVLNLLLRLQRELGLSYLFIAHDLSVVRHVSHRVAVMYLGTIVETGTRDQVFDAPAHPYTQALLSAMPIVDPGDKRPPRIVLDGDLPSPSELPSGCVFRTRCFKASLLCAEVEPRLRSLGPGSQDAACHYPTLASQEPRRTP